MYADWLQAQPDEPQQTSGRLIAAALERENGSSVALDEMYALLRDAAVGARGRLLFARPPAAEWSDDAGVYLDWRRGLVFRAGIHRVDSPVQALEYLLEMPATRFMTSLELATSADKLSAVLAAAPYVPPLRSIRLRGATTIDELRSRFPDAEIHT